MRRETLTDDVIAALVPEAKAYRVFDLLDRGLCVTVHPMGSKRLYRRKGQVWEPLGAWPGVTIASLRGPIAPRLSQLVERFQSHLDRLKPTTAYCYGIIFKQWIARIGDLPADQVTLELVKSNLPDGSNRWRNQSVIALGTLFGHCGLPNPILGYKRGKENKRDLYLTDEQIKRLWTICLDYGKRADLFRFLLATGFRLGEACGIRYRDVDWDNGSIYLEDTKTGSRTVYVSNQALEALRGHVSEGSDKPAWNRECRHTWVILRERLGMPDLRVHDLRHSFASLCIRNGVSIAQIGVLLGHGPGSSVTRRYVHLEGTQKTAPVVGAAIAGVLGV